MEDYGILSLPSKEVVTKVLSNQIGGGLGVHGKTWSIPTGWVWDLFVEVVDSKRYIKATMNKESTTCYHKEL